MAIKPRKSGRILDPKVHINPISTFAFANGFRDRMAGMPKEKGRWLTTRQQNSWEEAWDIMDELLQLREENKALRAKLADFTSTED